MLRLHLYAYFVLNKYDRIINRRLSIMLGQKLVEGVEQKYFSKSLPLSHQGSHPHNCLSIQLLKDILVDFLKNFTLYLTLFHLELIPGYDVRQNVRFHFFFRMDYQMFQNLYQPVPLFLLIKLCHISSYHFCVDLFQAHYFIPLFYVSTVDQYHNVIITIDVLSLGTWNEMCHHIILQDHLDNLGPSSM